MIIRIIRDFLNSVKTSSNPGIHETRFILSERDYKSYLDLSKNLANLKLQETSIKNSSYLGVRVFEIFISNQQIKLFD